MNKHDPYGPILEGLQFYNNVETDEELGKRLRGTKKYVTSLRKAYNHSPSNVDFSCPHTRAAYLLVYFPNYIEPVYEVLSLLSPDDINSTIGREEIKGIFLGAGPAPETVGLISFLRDRVNCAKSLKAYLLDKYSDQWEAELRITERKIAPCYWPKGKLTITSRQFDFLDPIGLWNPTVKMYINSADIVVMQNCLNDQWDNGDAINNIVRNIFRKSKSGTLFVIIDLNYPKVHDLIVEISKGISEDRLGRVILPLQDKCATVSRNYDIPKCVTDHLLTRDPVLRTIVRENTDYYYSVFQRT